MIQLISGADQQPAPKNRRVRWTFWHYLGGCGLASLLMLCGFVAGWTWARDDFFPQKLTLSAPPQGPNRVAIVADSDLQGDAQHSIGVSAGKSWQKWTEIVTQSEFADQKWQIFWSRDGTLVALKQSPGLIGDPRVKAAQFTHAFDFSTRKAHEAPGSGGQNPSDAWSRHIDALMKQRGGAVAARETQRDVGVWRWQDRALKDAL